jgi:hypothetical protein
MKKILIITFAISTIAASCNNPKHTAVVADSSLYEALNSTFVAEQAYFHSNPQSWNQTQSQGFNRKLLPAVDAGRQFNKILSNWQTGQPIPEELSLAITGITEALNQISTDFPDSATKTKILGYLATAESVILTALNVILQLKG